MINFKSSLVLAALGATVAANAVQFNFQSNGTSSLSSGVVTANNPILTRYTLGSTTGYTFTSLNYSYTPVFASGSMTGMISGTGTLAFSNPSSTPGTYTFSFSGDATRATSDATANTLVNVSFANLSFALVPTTGSALSLPFASGTFSGNKSGDAGDLSTTSFVSTLNATPEPASFAALGVGAVALLRRRRKA